MPHMEEEDPGWTQSESSMRSSHIYDCGDYSSRLLCCGGSDTHRCSSYIQQAGIQQFLQQKRDVWAHTSPTPCPAPSVCAYSVYSVYIHTAIQRIHYTSAYSLPLYISKLLKREAGCLLCAGSRPPGRFSSKAWIRL